MMVQKKFLLILMKMFNHMNDVVVKVTAKKQDGDLVEFDAMVCFDYLLKPITIVTVEFYKWF